MKKVEIKFECIVELEKSGVQTVIRFVVKLKTKMHNEITNASKKNKVYIYINLANCFVTKAVPSGIVTFTVCSF